MDSRAKIARLITDVDAASPAGFALGLHIEYTTPRFMFQTYPKKWLEPTRLAGCWCMILW